MDVSQYRCMTCGHREVNPNDDSWCNVMKDWISFIEEEFTETVGCASHTSQENHDKQLRDKVLSDILAIEIPSFDYALEESGFNFLMDKISELRKGED